MKTQFFCIDYIQSRLFLTLILRFEKKMKTYGWKLIYLLVITVHEMNSKALQQPFHKRNTPAITNGILLGNVMIEIVCLGS